MQPQQPATAPDSLMLVGIELEELLSKVRCNNLYSLNLNNGKQMQKTAHWLNLLSVRPKKHRDRDGVALGPDGNPIDPNAAANADARHPGRHAEQEVKEDSATQGAILASVLALILSLLGFFGRPNGFKMLAQALEYNNRSELGIRLFYVVSAV